MRHDLMAYINVKVQDRPAGQPASAESIERDRRLSVKVMEIAKLRALRLAAAPVRTLRGRRRIVSAYARQAHPDG